MIFLHIFLTNPKKKRILKVYKETHRVGIQYTVEEAKESTLDKLVPHYILNIERQDI